MSSIIAGIGRILIGLLFIASGATKLLAFHATDSVIAFPGWPSAFAIPSGLFELVGGIVLALGLLTRLISILLIAYVILTIVMSGSQMSNSELAVLALQDGAIIGGLMAVIAAAHMLWDYRDMQYRTQAYAADRDAAERLHEAELRAARAEGAATGDVVQPVVPPVRSRRRWFSW
jgi:putative oxidoreductase